MTGIGISRSIKTLGITGLRKTFARDGGIEEPYWDPQEGKNESER